ncbi:PAS domain S-box protein [uncultured Methanolobus sp.]|uniref:PAS domain S-box protein n=1 Tax=uncultured Methanolobus sp. TaxID=218300 RepID=UPI002AAC44A5|nr:PAS domain S-box protein [uncultured Methanolobus sp.]
MEQATNKYPDKVGKQNPEKPIDVFDKKDEDKHLDNVLESLGVIVWSATYPELKLIHISPPDKIVSGLKPGQTISSGGVLQDYVHSEDMIILDKAANERELQDEAHAEYRIVQDNRNIRVVHEYSCIIYDESKKPVYVCGIITDITNHELSCRERQAEEKLAEATIRKLIFFEQADDGIVVLDKNGRVLEVNQKFADMLGYSQEELMQMHVWDWDGRWTSEEQPEQFFKGPLSSYEPVENIYFETKHRRKDGSLYDVEIRTNAVIIKGEEMYFSVCRDITKAKETEKTLRENEERLSLAIEASGLGFWDLDIDADLLYLSPAVYTLLGYDTKESSSFHEIITTFLHPDDRDSFIKAVEESIVSLKPIFMDLKIQNISGETNWVSVRGKPINIDENGRPHHITGILVDISTRVRAEETLLYARAAADESNRMKNEMIRNISHELRTPLIAVLGFSDVLLNDSDNFTDIQKKFLKNIHESGNNLDDMIEKFLELVHIEQESVDTLNLQSVDLNKIIRGTCDLLSAKASKNNINVDIAIDAVPDTVIADPYKLRTILFNLIENAIKFTESGGTVKVESKTSDDNICFSVTDTGIGMEKEKIEAIFETFVQLDGSNTRKYGGTGLGLALVKKLVEAHKGHISVESHPGEGSNFSFTIPFEFAEKRMKI